MEGRGEVILDSPNSVRGDSTCVRHSKIVGNLLNSIASKLIVYTASHK